MNPILITRHGEGEHNLRTDVFMGRAPEARLTERGRGQARSLARRLAGGLAGGGARYRIVASSLPRTLETAKIVAEEVGAGDVTPEDAFWELSKGEWEGRMPRKLPQPELGEITADPFGYRHPGGESYRDVVSRVAPAFEHWTARHADQPMLFVLHGDVIRALLYHLIGFPPDRIGDWSIDPCSLSEVREQDTRRIIVRINDTAHLD